MLGLSRNVILLGIISGLNDVGSEMLMPILPLLIVSLGGGPLAVGLIGGVGDMIATGLKLPSGWWSDRIGRRKPFLWIGYLSSALARLGLAAAATWQHVLILRPLERAGKGIRDAPRDALIAESVAWGVRGAAFGLQRTLDTVGAIIGSIAAVMLIAVIGTQYQTIVLLAGAISLLSLIPMFFVKDVSKHARKIALSIGLKALPLPLRLYVAAATLFGMGNFTYMLFILRVQQLTGSVLTTVALYVVLNVLMAVMLVPAGRLADRIGRRNVLLFGWLLFAVVAAGFALATDMIMVAIMFACYGIAYALFDGNQRALAADLAPAQLKGTALGTLHAAIGASGLIGGLVAGGLWQAINPTSAFMFSAILATCGAVLLLFAVPNTKP
ncbi:MAG: MFS transporter [Candidatus Aenigmatarchaeota archaeon]|nr:MFS transporter [Candidatus Aenigmarchaeota archaeon]